MEKIVILPSVQQKLSDLAELLFQKEYFGFMDSAIKYVTDLQSFIYTIPDQRSYPTKRSRYGQWYCRYKPNKNTTWYITFDTDGQRYIIKNIINNHTRDYPAFIRGL